MQDDPWSFTFSKWSNSIRRRLLNNLRSFSLYVSVWPITRSSLTRFSFDSSRFYWSIAVSPISLFLCSRRLYRVISLDITLGSLSRINTRLREREISWLRSPFVRSSARFPSTFNHDLNKDRRTLTWRPWKLSFDKKIKRESNHVILSEPPLWLVRKHWYQSHRCDSFKSSTIGATVVTRSKTLESEPPRWLAILGRISIERQQSPIPDH